MLVSSLLLTLSNAQANTNKTPTDRVEKLAEYTMHYEAEVEGFDVKIERQLTALTNQQYRIEQVAKAALMRLIERSEFTIKDSQLLTENYLYLRKVWGFNKKYQVNWQGPKSATHHYKKDKTSLKSDNRLYSLLSYQTEIRRRLLAGNTDLQLNLVSKNRVRDYLFEVAGQETINTKAGKLDTIKIVRDRKGKDKKTTIWLAKDFQYVIIKIMHYEDGELKYRLDFDNGTLAGKTIKQL